MNVANATRSAEFASSFYMAEGTAILEEIQASEAIKPRGETIQRLRNFGYYGIIVAAVLILLLGLAGKLPSSMKKEMIPVVGTAGAIALALVISSFYKRYLRSRDRSRENIDFELTADGFVTTGRHDCTRIPWTEFTTWKETATLFLFVLSSGEMLILPKRLLASSQRIDLVRKWISAAHGDRT